MQTLIYVLGILGSVGMMLFVKLFSFATCMDDYRSMDKKLGMNGYQWWNLSWVLIILAGVLQLFLHLNWLPPEWFPSSK